MIFKDYYKILELNNNKATNEQIKVAFREQAKKYHPDVNGGNSRYEERFKDINEAYKILSDERSRRRYDRQWSMYSKRRGAKGEKKEKAFDNFFGVFFGKQDKPVSNANKAKEKVIKGENIETEVDIKLEEAFYGAEKRIALRTTTGKMKTFAVKIPEGILDGEKIRLLEQGKNGKNGGKSGDLFIKVNIQKDNKYHLEGYDLVTDLYLTPWEAALGKRVSINSISEPISIYVPPGVQSGERIRIAQKGYKKGEGKRGDLIAEVKMVVPQKLSSEEKELFEKLKNVSKFNPRSE